jgi:hypothetical protein
VHQVYINGLGFFFSYYNVVILLTVYTNNLKHCLEIYHIVLVYRRCTPKPTLTSHSACRQSTVLLSRVIVKCVVNAVGVYVTYRIMFCVLKLLVGRLSNMAYMDGSAGVKRNGKQKQKINSKIIMVFVYYQMFNVCQSV